MLFFWVYFHAYYILVQMWSLKMQITDYGCDKKLIILSFMCNSEWFWELVILLLKKEWCFPYTEPEGQVLYVQGRSEEDVASSLERVLRTMRMTSTEMKVMNTTEIWGIRVMVKLMLGSLYVYLYCPYCDRMLLL